MVGSVDLAVFGVCASLSFKALGNTCMVEGRGIDPRRASFLLKHLKPIMSL